MPDPNPPTDSSSETDPREMDHRLRYAARLETVGLLASGFAHELGTPLNVVLGRARMISRGQVEGAAAVECAEIIIEQARRMTVLVRHLLTFARSRPSPTTRLDLSQVLDEACQLLSPIAHKRRVELTVDHGDGGHPVKADGGALQQVIANIVMNAIDVMPRGGEVRLSLTTRDREHPDTGQAGAWHGLTIADEGPGIPEAIRERIFEPFFTTKDVGAGTGLGLSVAYGIVRDHGGWMDIADAEPGPGAALTIWLPADAD